MKKINYLILLIVVFVGISCEPTYKKEYSWAYPVAGDWKVKAYVDGEVVSDPFEMKSYNSSFGKDSIWFDDYGTKVTPNALGQLIGDGNYWTMKFKAAVNIGAQTFSTVGSTNAISGYPIKIVVSEGQVIGKDSITMKVVFGDDPTTTYQFAGHRETSYEDYINN